MRPHWPLRGALGNLALDSSVEAAEADGGVDDRADFDFIV